MAKKKPKKKIPPDSSVPRRPDRDRRVRQSERLARVLSVLNLIQSRGRWNARAISEELECSERTVYRDLEVLEFSGVPWFYDEQEQCYRVRPDYRFPTLTLTKEEAVGQVLATALTKTPGLDIGPGAGPTTRKLAVSSDEQIQDLLADAARMIEVFNLKLVDHSKHQEIIKSIQFSLLQGKQITGVYESPYEPKPRKLAIHPYRLCLVKQAWYVIGHIDGESEAKTFRAARFRTVRMMDQPAIIPENFHLKTHFGNAWAVYRGESSYQIELRFEPDAARIVTETIWHHTQHATPHKDGTVTLKFTVDGLDEILRWILTWTGKVTIVGPDELKSRFHETLECGLEMNT